MNALGKIKAFLRNYLWSGSENTTRARVSWDDCTMPKKVGDLSLTSPEHAMKALMSKWVTQALLPEISNLQTVLRHCIKQLQPSTHGPWGPSTLWLFSPHFSTKGGTKVWHHITQSWKGMAKMVTHLIPTIPEDTLQLNLWWRTKYQGIHSGILMCKAYTFYKSGLRNFTDIWDPWKYDFPARTGRMPKQSSPWKKSTMTFGSN